MILSHAYVHSTLLTNIGIFMGNSSYNNTKTETLQWNSQGLESTREHTVPLTSSALTLTVSTTQNNFLE